MSIIEEEVIALSVQADILYTYYFLQSRI